MEDGVEYSGFADDIAIWASGKTTDEAKAKIERALIKIEQWSATNKIELNPTKSEACLFTRTPGEKNINLDLNIANSAIATVKTIKFLGISIDQGLTFKEQVDTVVSKMKKRSTVIRALAGHSWGWDTTSLTRIYQAVVESVCWYASAAWHPWLSCTHLEKLERAQREGLRAAVGLTATSPTEAVYLESDIIPIRTAARSKSIIAYEKAIRMDPEAPLRKISERQGRRRLAANKGWREQSRELANAWMPWPRQELAWKRGPPWKGPIAAGVQLYDTLIQECSKESPAEERRKAAEDTISQRGTFELVLFSDGSAIEGIKQGGAACVGTVGEEHICDIRPAGQLTSSYTAETIAMIAAVEQVLE
jgi:hypothetical protein